MKSRVRRISSNLVQRGAIFSDCRRYRYVLRRGWDAKRPAVLFVALNPSTADEICDDPTIRRCIGFAQSWGFGSLIVANLFALRSADPSALKIAADPIGPRNDWWLRMLSAQVKLTIVAWGMHGSLHHRSEQVLPKLHNVHHLGLTRQGHPKHPLYLHRSIVPRAF